MREYEAEYLAPAPNVAAAAGREVLIASRNTGRALLILLEAFLWLGDVLRHRQAAMRQLFVCGVKSLGVTSVVALFTGMILALQAGLILSDYGQEVQVGTLVSQTMCREMGPFMTALILAASVGSAMAAEIGTMSVSEEIDALNVMSINPVRFLVVPRLFALMLMCPILTVYTNIVGISGGMLVANTQLGVSPQAYYDNALLYLGNKEIYVGLFKAWIFGIIITAIACYHGLAASGGAVGVGRATRITVVHSFLLILVSGYIITRLFY
jgi:phospholipid/cholesterol/gamma-HCH transport system permease protein